MSKLNLPNIFEIGPLSEIRKRLIIYLIIFFSTWLAVFLFFPRLFPYLLFPYFHLLKEKRLVFISLEEALMVVVRASFYIALTLTFPILVIQLFRALSRELYEYERRLLKKLIFLSFFLSLFGIIVGYFFLTPLFLKFFLYFGKNFESNLRLSSFLFFMLKVVLYSIIVFQLPILFALLIREEILTEELYRKRRLYFWGGFYLLSALFLPSDFLGQLLLTLFFYLFFKLSFIIARFLD